MRTYGGPQFQVTQHVMSRFSEAIERAGTDVVPQVVIGGGAGGAGGNLMEGLLAMLLSEQLGATAQHPGNHTPANDETERQRAQIRGRLAARIDSQNEPSARTNGHSA